MKLAIAGSLIAGSVAVSGVAATTSPSPPQGPDWQKVVLLHDTPGFTLPGNWTSVETRELDSKWQDEFGNWHYKYKTLTQNVVTVDSSCVRALVDSGTPTDMPIPADCRIALKWAVTNASAWWSTETCDSLADGKGHPCKSSFVQKDATDEESQHGETRPLFSSYRTCYYDAEAVKQHRVKECRLPAAQGEVTIHRDGRVAIGPFTEEQHPENFAILCGVKTSGDVFFWVVQKP
ncbi:MAG: hypothetical protein U1E76_26315 [Planctomycetota bacterium]